MKELNRPRPATETRRNAYLEKRGIFVGKRHPREIQVDLGDQVTATIRGGDPMETIDIHTQVRNVHVQNGGDVVMVVDAEHVTDGKHDFYLLGDNSFEKLTDVRGRENLALELAVALMMNSTEDPKIKRALRVFPHAHVHEDAVNHILSSKELALDH